MQRAEKLLRRADGWVFAQGDATRLAAVRIGLCLLLAVRLASTDYGEVAGQPTALFQPLSYMRLFSRMPSADVAHTLQICGVAAALLAAGAIALRASLSLAVVCSLVLNGMLNSTGKVNYNDALLTLCLLLLLACGPAAGEALAIRDSLHRLSGLFNPRPTVNAITAERSASSERYGWPIRTAMIVIALAYFFAALQKWRYSGVAWVTSDNLRWILYAASDKQAHPNGLGLFIADRSWLAHLFAAGSLLLETTFPLVLFVPRLRWLLIPSVVAMHVGISLTIGLDYSAQWLTVVIVFVNWPVLVAWVRQRGERNATPA